jgi:hypothetical protein
MNALAMIFNQKIAINQTAQNLDGYVKPHFHAFFPIYFNQVSK